MFAWTQDYDANRMPYEWLLPRISRCLGGQPFYPQRQDPLSELREEDERAGDSDTNEELDEADEAALEKGRLDMGKLRRKLDNL